MENLESCRTLIIILLGDGNFKFMAKICHQPVNIESQSVFRKIDFWESGLIEAGDAPSIRFASPLKPVCTQIRTDLAQQLAVEMHSKSMVAIDQN